MQISRDRLPSTGRMLADMSAGTIDSVAYNRDQPERIRKTLYYRAC